MINNLSQFNNFLTNHFWQTHLSVHSGRELEPNYYYCETFDVNYEGLRFLVDAAILVLDLFTKQGFVVTYNIVPFYPNTIKICFEITKNTPNN